MHIYDIIAKKRDGLKLKNKEIEFVINGYTKGDIPDYQMAAFLMAVYIRGMDKEETTSLTSAMLHSGDIVDLSNIKGFKVDKHSTGGVGDTTTLVLAPLVASTGLSVAKMSGRGLGHTGGTLDKLESFSGFRVELSMDKFIKNVNNIGIAVIGQTANIAPADKKIYALRDVTATVSSIPLIAASIMSKKLAAGSNGIVLDVKTGIGAFMQKLEDSILLAETMINIGKDHNKKMNAIISNMDQPLGYAIGNKLEVREAILTLMDKGPEDLKELCLTLGSLMLLQAEKVKNETEAKKILNENIKNGKALQKFKEFVIAQGGDPLSIENPDTLLCATQKMEIVSPEDGFITRCDSLKIGKASFVLGAGRKTKEDTIDLDAGVILNKKIGDPVKKGEILAILYTNDKSKLVEAKELILKAYNIGEKTEKPVLIYKIL